jgi:hypothetical protein
MPITRDQLVNKLLPGLDKLFNDAYAQRFQDSYVIKKERHRYHIWVCGKTHTKLVAKNIQRRREALAIIKLLKATKEN